MKLALEKICLFQTDVISIQFVICKTVSGLVFGRVSEHKTINIEAQKLKFALQPCFCQTEVVRVVYFSNFSFLKIQICKKMIVAGAKAGIKQNGNFVISKIPCEFVSIACLVI